MTDESFDTLGDLPTIEGSDGGESKMLAGRYRIIRKLGEGGMGLVYLAEDTDLGNERVAIKFIPPTLANNERAIKNLKKEAQTARQLSHPNIVRLHDLHTDGHQKFLVMEYIDGKTLEQALAEKESDKFTLEELLPIAEQIAAGLDYAHKRKVLHRDLKPSNIMIAKDSTVKLLDFGIAREMKDSYTRVTGKETSGTLPYMSPDQLMGEPPTVAMDVYSFGAVLYECLSGHPPFYMGDIREQIKSKIPADLSDVETSVNNAIQSALAKSSDQRPENTSDLVKMLKGKKKAPDIKDTLDYAQTINIKVEEQKARKKKVKIFAAVIVFVLLVISGYAVFRYTTEQKHGLKTDSEKPQQKRDIFDQIAAEQEQSFRNLIEAAFICEAKEDWEKAIEGYSKALAIKPDDAEVKDKLATCQHNLYLAKAESAEAQRDLDSAIDNYTKALSYKQVASTQMKLDTAKKTLQAKIETEHKKREYDKWIAQAQESEKEGDLTAAVKFYQKAQSYTDGSLQSKIDSLNTQIAEAEKLKKFNELLTFAKANDNKANGKEALKVLAEALALYPDNSEALALQKKIQGYFGPNPNEVITNSIGMKLVYILAGEFTMGSPSDEKDRGSDEGSQHRVRISKGFYMGIYEVTQSQWEQVMGTTVGQQRDRADKSWKLYGTGTDYPMYYVSWEEAVDFCERLSQKENGKYRLPTEAEWEYACRAGTDTRFYYGNDLSYSQLGEYAWYGNNSGSETHPVGQKKPNAFGLYDMHGNVWEWCQDWYGENYYSQRSEVDPKGPDTGTARVLRGGSWFNLPRICRSASRLRLTPGYRFISGGFRVVSLDFK